MNICNDEEGIYLIHTREFYNNNKPIFKIGRSHKLENRINSLTSTSNNGGFSVTEGFIFKQTDGKAFLQLNVKNVSANLKSWSFTGGQYGDPSAKYYAAESKPSGCLFPGQAAYFEAQISGLPQIAKNTEAVFDAPTFNGCGDGSTRQNTTFRFLTN